MKVNDALGSSQVFSGVGPVLLDALVAQGSDEHHDAGAVILHEGEVGDSFYVVCEGELVVEKGEGNARRELGALVAGDAFGEMALVSNEPRSATIIASTPVRLFRLDRGDFDALMAREPVFAQRLLALISRHMRRSDDVASLQLLRAHQGLILSLSQLAESRDPETGAHLLRVRDYCVLLAKRLQEQGLFQETITGAFVDALNLVSPLHDIGKVAIPDSVLLKPGDLTPAEWKEMRTHPVKGAEALDTVLDYCDLNMFRIAQRLVLRHHERYDGGGYPDGLQGEDIPLEARIMSVADVYDALRTERSYKKAFDRSKTIRIMQEGRDTQFDARIVDVLLADVDEFERIRATHRDDRGSAA
ncbi:MAG TPA: cyclic nucleotide-binding domain-containing protein [Candidatus Hydrogenedentes bacterium]|nr:cyclic nucleotide-binding domain-containing protein [Candidatus Hydrogenedentota bacterium]HPG67623.1 cyclic nucleotide-binding domain-containing protein [Candidatus Hydrogenedentota bacterium]